MSSFHVTGKQKLSKPIVPEVAWTDTQLERRCDNKNRGSLYDSFAGQPVIYLNQIFFPSAEHGFIDLVLICDLCFHLRAPTCPLTPASFSCRDHLPFLPTEEAMRRRKLPTLQHSGRNKGMHW